MKIIIACLIVLACTLLGKAIAEIYVKRENFFFELADFLKEAIRSITVLKEPISKCALDFPEIKEFANFPDSVFQKKFLKRNEQERICEYFKKFGLCDSALEGKRAEDFLYFAKSEAEASRRERETKGKLCVKLGFIIGVAIAVLCM